jgi:hypothetical protein
MDNIINYKKYLKYRLKYIKLKEQIGGAKFVSIPNNGSRRAEPYLGLQCLWISIRDFIDYHRGISTTVRELKRRLGLGPETDRTEFDEYNPMLASGLERLCRGLQITLNFIYVRSNGIIAPFCLDEQNRMTPAKTINPGARETLYIATFGRHFELIVNGPNYVLPRHANSSIPEIRQQYYQPKVNIREQYVNPETLQNYNQRHLATYKMKIIENEQNIMFFYKEIAILTEDKKVQIKTMNDCEKIGLPPLETARLLVMHVKNIDAIEEQIEFFRNKIAGLNEELVNNQAIIKTLQS